jgi:hypothetical protein
MNPRLGTVARILAAAGVLASLLFLSSLPARADEEQKPAVNGRNAKIQLSGVGWAVFRYKLQDETRKEAPPNTFTGDAPIKNSHSFDIDRVYLTADYAFTDRYSWQTTIEMTNFGGKLNMFMKRALIKIRNPFGLTGTAVRMGQINHVMTGTVEDVWGYRSVAKIPLDRYLGVSTTWDGAGLEGQAFGGVLDFDAAVANEQAYNKTDAAGNPIRSQYPTGMGRITFIPMPQNERWKGLRLAVFGMLNMDKASFKTDGNYWWSAFPHYKGKSLTLGLEVAEHHDRAVDNWPTKGHVVDRVDRCVSGIASCDLTGAVKDLGLNWTGATGIFGRLDLVDPALKIGGLSLKGEGWTTLIGGFSHTYVKGVRSILDAEYTHFKMPKPVPAGLKSYNYDLTLSARMEVTL